MIRPALAEAVLDLAMALARLANWIDPLTPPTPKPRHASASAHAPVVGLGRGHPDRVVVGPVLTMAQAESLEEAKRRLTCRRWGRA